MKATIELGWEPPRRRGVKELARRLGYSTTYISRVLAGKLKPGRPIVRKMRRIGLSAGTEVA